LQPVAVGPSIPSSASNQKIHGERACRTLSLRAAAKLSIQGKSNTPVPSPAASSRVRSVEPVSTTIISANRQDKGPRQAGTLRSSFLTIMQSETGGGVMVPHGFSFPSVL
jgi:hypothetical protein